MQLETDGADHVLVRSGSGARAFGNSLLATRGASGAPVPRLHVDLHWDRIMGFPFFVPTYLPGNHVTIYGCHDALEEAFRRAIDPFSMATLGYVDCRYRKRRIDSRRRELHSSKPIHQLRERVSGTR